MPQELFDWDLEVDMTDVSPDQVGVLRGLDAAQYFREYWETFDDFHVEIEEVINAEEDQVVTAARDGGHVRGSDTEVWNRFFHVWTFGDGKIVRLFDTHRPQAGPRSRRAAGVATAHVAPGPAVAGWELPRQSGT